MSTCATCVHWLPTTSDHLCHIKSLGTCQYVRQYWDATEWTKDDDHRKVKDSCVNQLAFVQDGSDYYAELLTLATFGCAAHSLKD